MDVGNYINKSRTEIQYDLSRGLKFIYSNKWIVATGVDEIVLENYKEKPRPFNKVLIIDEKTTSEIIACSIKHAARLTNVNSKTITKNLNTGKITKGLSFRALE